MAKKKSNGKIVYIETDGHLGFFFGCQGKTKKCSMRSSVERICNLRFSWNLCQYFGETLLKTKEQWGVIVYAKQFRGWCQDDNFLSLKNLFSLFTNWWNEKPTEPTCFSTFILVTLFNSTQIKVLLWFEEFTAICKLVLKLKKWLVFQCSVQQSFI